MMVQLRSPKARERVLCVGNVLGWDSFTKVYALYVQ